MHLTREIAFEEDICQHLADNGWLYSPDDTGYDRELALYPPDLFAWLEETQPATWRRYLSSPGTSQTELLRRLAKVLATDGTLKVLRSDFKITGAGTRGFQLVQFKPASGFNPDTAKSYERVRLRVMRQVYYSASNQNSIDLVLFANGIPVATLELKTDFTQAVEDAKQQYRHDRPPRDPKTRKEEPLLTFKRGALVHFALSTEEAWMTTHLKGDGTTFLPFNLGNVGGKGNPPNPHGYRTAYLWENLLQRDAWLRVLGSFIQFDARKNQIIFPRYHQWAAVNRLIETARVEGPGHTYLFQHSAGSGKSNTIAWCAQQLSTLHDARNQKVFDSVIILTDRTVLDEQLKETLEIFVPTPGVVASIDSGHGSKSGHLANALQTGALIIVVTIQTFPHIMAELRKGEGLAGKKFAVIIDEAHSSQSGSTARRVRATLGYRNASLKENDKESEATQEVEEEDTAESGDSLEASSEGGGEEISTEDMILAEAKSRPLPSNASFLAFTATPKPTTLQLFGRPPDATRPPGEGNVPEPFDHYSMRQAIEEGFILDVLRNFMPYRVAYRLAHNGKEWDDKLVDESEARKALARWVRLHPYNISQKVQIIVEHYRAHVRPLLDGTAKAMVVTESREEAVRYKVAMDRYIQESGYTDIATLVAFSSDITVRDLGLEKVTEISMNPTLKGRQIPKAFETPEYQVLIVANKYQTGFDQPRLVAMYVDKRLDGIAAVQTLSRLNRIYPGKEATFILDFVNSAEEMRKAFAPYYGKTELLATTDPNLIYDLQTRLSQAQIYTEQEAESVALLSLKAEQGLQKVSQKELMVLLTPPVQRFKHRWTEAEQAEDQQALDALTIFHKNLGAFCRLYDFLSQIVPYEDATLEANYIFFKCLEPLIKPGHVSQKVDLSSVILTHHAIKAAETTAIYLHDAPPEERLLKPITALGTRTPHEAEQARLTEIIALLNDLFGEEQITDADRVGMFQHVVAKMMENAEIARQSRANTIEQFQHSPNIEPAFIDAVVTGMDNYQTMGAKILQDPNIRQQYQTAVTNYTYKILNGDECF